MCELKSQGFTTQHEQPSYVKKEQTRTKGEGIGEEIVDCKGKPDHIRHTGTSQGRETGHETQHGEVSGNLCTGH